MISTSRQQKIWEEEHTNPHLLLPMNSREASHGVSLFWRWLQEKNPRQIFSSSHTEEASKGDKIEQTRRAPSLHGLEMGCGKGRNSIWLATQGATMTAFDFSRVAIKEAKKRAAGLEKLPHFFIQDATQLWPLEANSFDFAIDCFASTDIDSLEGRTFARNELWRVLKPDGYLLVYTLSTDDAFHQAMRQSSPALEKNSFFHSSNGKFEKVFDEEELKDFYRDWKWIEKKRLPKTATFFNKEYDCFHFWMVFQKKIKT